jgi:hypothetical protein
MMFFYNKEKQPERQAAGLPAVAPGREGENLH